MLTLKPIFPLSVLLLTLVILWAISHVVTKTDPSPPSEGKALTVTSVNFVYDGDTFWANIPALGTNKPIRVEGVDTPEIKGLCASETERAFEAKAFTRNKLKQARKITISPIKTDRYNRLVALVFIDGVRLDKQLIANHLGRPYFGGRRKGWCE